MEWLRSDNTGNDTIDQLRERLEGHQIIGIDPVEISRLGYSLEYWVEVFLSSTDVDGSYNAVLRRKEKSRIPFFSLGASLYDDTAPLKPFSEYASNPVYGKIARGLIPELRDYLKLKVPEYMIPSAFMILAELPLTHNGKIDKHKLPAPWEARIGLRQEYVAPRTEVEKKLTLIWSEVLGIEQIGIHDNFFDLGGNSLLIAKCHIKIGNILPQNITMMDLFKYPNICALSEFIEHGQSQKNTDRKTISRGKIRNIRRDFIKQQRETRQRKRRAY